MLPASRFRQTVPSQPTGLSAQVEASDEVKLSWSDTANDFTGYTVERQREAGDTTWQNIATTTGTTYSYVDTTGPSRRRTITTALSQPIAPIAMAAR